MPLLALEFVTPQESKGEFSISCSRFGLSVCWYTSNVLSSNSNAVLAVIVIYGGVMCNKHRSRCLSFFWGIRYWDRKALSKLPPLCLKKETLGEGRHSALRIEKNALTWMYLYNHFLLYMILKISTFEDNQCGFPKLYIFLILLIYGRL